jgi:hypothetical protein
VAKRGESGIIIYRGVFFSGRKGELFKCRDTNGERGGEEGIENPNLQSSPVALTLISSCSQVALFKGLE